MKFFKNCTLPIQQPTEYPRRLIENYEVGNFQFSYAKIIFHCEAVRLDYGRKLV